MDMFARALAPISGDAFQEIDAQAVETLKANLSARRFVDVKGPYGWDYACVNEGRYGAVQQDGEVGYAVRVQVPVVESRVEFELNVIEMHNVDRGADDPDLVPVEKAAKAAAAFEEKVIYVGLENAGIKGMYDSSENPPIELPKNDPEAFLQTLKDVLYRLKTEESIAGPYALVGGKALLDALGKLVSGRTFFDVVKSNTDIDEYIYTPTYDGAFLVSKRGGDFELTLGGDFSIGYTGREGDNLKFFLTESFAFRILEPRAFSVIQLK